ncbi:MAG: hypothetical protein KDB04_10470 [Acidimicrobiales bacterium]|nr:hypothetical protein [Acidimicrobiales bacterium]HRW36354.1 DUF6159 family protein [Aquihabitans sp.]
MGRWERSKALAGASWAVVREDKELMALPLISGIASIAIAATFLVPALLTSKVSDVGGETTLQPSLAAYALVFAVYLVLAYVTIFFKTALLCGADERMRGGNPTLASALAGAGACAGRIVPWAVVSATVSVILRSIQERSGLVGRVVVGFVGMAWAVVTFLVLPTLVFEGVGVGEAIRRSTAMLKQTWGENLIVNAGIGLLSFALCIPAFVVIALGIGTGTALGIGVTLVIGVLWLIAVACWSSAMSAVFQLALYRYATQAPLPAPFAQIELGQAFTTKGSRRGPFGA